MPAQQVGPDGSLALEDAGGLFADRRHRLRRSQARVAAGEVKPGFQIPSLAFGAEYILNFDGVTREDLNS
jgi:hypothetical protein